MARKATSTPLLVFNTIGKPVAGWQDKGNVPAAVDGAGRVVAHLRERDSHMNRKPASAGTTIDTTSNSRSLAVASNQAAHAFQEHGK